MRLANNKLNAFDLTNTSEKTIESEIFDHLYFICENTGVKIFAGKNGALCLDYKAVKQFCKELIDVAELWKDIDTNECVMPQQQGRRLKKKELCDNI